MTYDFDRETASTVAGDGRRSGVLSARWNIGDNPNGGYLTSVALRAMGEAVEHPDPLSVTTHFLRPGLGGEPCETVLEVLRQGRQLSHVRASLRQQGEIRLELMAIFGDLSGGSGMDAARSLPPPEVPPPEDCPPRSPGAQGIPLPILERLDVRLVPPREAQEPEAVLRGWIRFRDGRPPDVAALGLFVDSFPPSPLTVLGSVGWVPTLELTVHARRRPAPGWILGQFETRDLDRGRMIEDGMLWDSEGHLVAQSRQLGLVMRRDP